MLMSIEQEKNAAAELNAKYQQENRKDDKMVNLIKNWSRASEAMGSWIKAAYACAKFEQFLEQKE